MSAASINPFRSDLSAFFAAERQQDCATSRNAAVANASGVSSQCRQATDAGDPLTSPPADRRDSTLPVINTMRITMRGNYSPSAKLTIPWYPASSTTPSSRKERSSPGAGPCGHVMTMCATPVPKCSRWRWRDSINWHASPGAFPCYA